MRKHVILMLLFYTILFSIHAQDIIYKKDGSEIQAKVLEIEESNVKYKLFTQQDGPTRNVKKSEVFLIIYEDGTKEKFADTPQTPPTEATVPVVETPVKKKVIERSAPLPGAPSTIRELYPVGTIMAFTKQDGILMFDNAAVKKVTPYHRVKIKSVPPGVHTIQVKGAVDSPVEEVTVEADDLITYTIYPDSVILNSSNKKLDQMDDRIRIRSKYWPKQKGFYNLTRGGMGFDCSGGLLMWGMSTINGYQFSPIFSAGVGIGYQSFRYIYDYATNRDIIIETIPIFGNMKINFYKNRLSVFFIVSIGVNLPASKGKLPIYYRTNYDKDYYYEIIDMKSRYYLSGGPGVQLYIGKFFTINASAEISFQSITLFKTYHNPGDISSSEYSTEWLPILFSIGFGF